MACCKAIADLTHSTHLAFDVEYLPGAVAIHSGIYRCTHCSREIVLIIGQHVPICCQSLSSHPPHTAWRLGVAAN